mmetsp:Transcript_24059/g.32970  ORF Transcript_24059/g.32970 Transcript_24059/m.32970 type:complete len:108 (-) Transcript_24059:92-415(-)
MACTTGSKRVVDKDFQWSAKSTRSNSATMKQYPIEGTNNNLSASKVPTGNTTFRAGTKGTNSNAIPNSSEILACLTAKAINIASVVYVIKGRMFRQSIKSCTKGMHA